LGLKTAYELRGVSCFALDEFPDPQKNMVFSRSLGEEITEYEKLKVCLSLFAARAAEKLRKRELKAKTFCFFIKTSPFKENYYSNGLTVTLPCASSDTRDFLTCIDKGLEKIFKKGLSYKKAGVFLTDFCKEQDQFDLFAPIHSSHSLALMNTIDVLNKRFGKGSVRFAVCGAKQFHRIEKVNKRENLSPAFTTSWSHLPVVY